MSTCKKWSDTPQKKLGSLADINQGTQKHKGISIFSAIDRVWQFFLSAADGENELKIWQTSDRDGNTWWHGCDRTTGRSTCVATDDEMRAWIDRHYYQ
ncbi:hypothetical protein QT971_02425 [Microcoleus sp. herbarium19]|uniref:hypothetical protein n=1 Tax=unclassified Microcoleus TaxID=2642155 RepID=UPI002FD6EDD3